ncbi:MAG: zinc ribbon domain-containing protein [Bryobacteraceae bacterium]
MELAVALTLLVFVVGFVFLIRPADLRPPEPVSPTAYLDERKARIYESLRDLQFEFRLGKLSDEDYQRTKLDLQKELAGVLAGIEELAPAPAAKPRPTPKPQDKSRPGFFECPHCGAKFETAMKFCGECGKAMNA